MPLQFRKLQAGKAEILEKEEGFVGRRRKKKNGSK